MSLHFTGLFWATAAAIALFFLCLLAASASIGQFRTAWRSYTMSIVFVAIAMVVVYIYHALFAATPSPVRLTWYMAASAIAFFRAAQYFRKAWRTTR